MRADKLGPPVADGAGGRGSPPAPAPAIPQRLPALARNALEQLVRLPVSAERPSRPRS